MIPLYPTFDGRRLIPTKRGAQEMMEIGIDLWDAADILSTGEECSRGQRGPGKIERCLRYGNKVVRVVAVLGPYDLEDVVEEAFFIIHASQESFNKYRNRKVGGMN